jgi:hypothetical protein
LPWIAGDLLLSWAPEAKKIVVGEDVETLKVFSNPKMSLKEAKGRRSGFCPFGI